jgi:phage-related minor tail protein
MASEMQGKLVITADTTQGQAALKALTTALAQSAQASTSAATAAAQTAMAVDQTGQASAKAAAGQSSFVTALRDQVATVGKSETALLQYRAAQAGVAAEAQPLITQLQNIKAAQAAKAAEDAAAAQAARDQAAAVRGQAAAQQQFITSLQDQVATRGLKPDELLKYRAAQLGVSEEADTLIAQLTKTGKAGQISAGQTAAAFRQLPAQFTDIATQLQGGASPFTILLQQGGQIKDSFGGVKPAIAAVAASIGPVVAVTALLAVGFAPLVAGFIAGKEESNSLTRALALQGNVSGLTLGMIDSLARSVSASGKVTIGMARDVTAALVDMGKFSSTSIDSTARAAVSLSRVSGQSAAEIVQGFSGIADGVAAWAQKANTSYNFLTGAQFAQIKSLEAQGRTQDAVKVAMDALSTAMDSRQVPALGLLDRALKTTKESFSSWWDKVKDFGRDESFEQRIDSQRKAIERLNNTPVRRGQNRTIGSRDTQVASIQADLDTNEEARRLQERAARQQATVAAKNKKDIEDQSSGHQNALASIQTAGAANALAQGQLSLQQMQAATDEAFRHDEQTAREHQAELLRIEQARLDTQLANINRQAQIQQDFKPGNEDERLAQSAKLAAFEAQRLALQQQRVKLLEEEVSGKRDVVPLARTAGPADALRRFKPADEANVTAFNAQQLQASAAAQAEISAKAHQLGIDLIHDNQARGQAQIADDIKTLTQRLALESQSVEDRKRLTDDLAAYRVLRERQLAEEMKPGWQKLVDGWADTNRLMRESSDEMMEHLVKGGEDAFVKFARTGKLNLKDLGSTLLDDTLRTSYRKLISGDSGKSGLDIASKLFGGIGASQGGSKGGAGDTFSSWERDLADMSDSAKTAGNSLQQSAAAGDGLAGMLGAVGGGLGAFANFVQMAAQAVMSLAATAGSSSGGGLAGALAGLFGGANGKAGGGDAAGAGSAAAARGATFAGGVAMFARGGTFTNQVVSRPTPFRFRNGGSLQQGLMGEAGPEAVMPLQSQGSGLGVAALDSRGRQIGVMALARGPGGRLGAVVADHGAGSTRARFAAGGWFGAGAGTWASPARFAAGGAFDAGVGTRMAQAMAPAAVATGAGAGVTLHVTVAPVISIDARTDKAQVVQLVQQGMQQATAQAQAQMLDMMKRNRAAFGN